MKSRVIVCTVAVALTLLVAAGAAGLSAEPRLNASFAKLDTMLQHRIDGAYGVSVVIGSDSAIEFTGAYGFADSARTKPVDSLTLFNIASITKSFTSLEIFRLIEQHRLSLADTIGTFITGVPADKSAITIAQLLSHTAGFEQHYVNSGLSRRAAAVAAIRRDSLAFPPGSDFSYSNENYELLAAIIEIVTGEKYENVIRHAILIPLGMNHTWFWDEAWRRGDIAALKDPLPDSLLDRNWDYIGSGGIFSTPADLYRFWKAVADFRLISQATTKQLFKSRYRTSSGIDIGYGWFITNPSAWGGREIWTRGTESWGHNAVVRWFPERDTVIIVCTNSGELGDPTRTGNRLVSSFIADFLWK